MFVSIFIEFQKKHLVTEKMFANTTNDQARYICASFTKFLFALFIHLRDSNITFAHLKSRHLRSFFHTSSLSQLPIVIVSFKSVLHMALYTAEDAFTLVRIKVMALKSKLKC